MYNPPGHYQVSDSLLQIIYLEMSHLLIHCLQLQCCELLLVVIPLQLHCCHLQLHYVRYWLRNVAAAERVRDEEGVMRTESDRSGSEAPENVRKTFCQYCCLEKSHYF